MKKKRIFSLFVAVVLVFSISIQPVQADDGPVSTEIIYLDNGVYIVSEIYKLDINLLSGAETTSGSKINRAYDSNDNLLFTVTVNGTFEYDGSSAEATRATYNYHIYGDGWRFDGGRAYCDGATAIADVTFSKALLSDANLIVTLTCSPDGELS
ncbi:MAG TPA: hypothetical protein IAD33_00975 [Candidatus Scatomorpha gallistercoris]|nr:hypothetical protein [Candidatus Scatomorpha gallistercoris]